MFFLTSQEDHLRSQVIIHMGIWVIIFFPPFVFYFISSYYISNLIKLILQKSIMVKNTEQHSCF